VIAYAVVGRYGARLEQQQVARELEQSHQEKKEVVA
jgi:hypothetical protein